MASGKTTVGTALAEKLRVPFLDTDSMIVKAAGKNIPEIFRDEGETGFRDREYDAAKSVSSLDPCVISTGGGMLTFDRNGKILSASGTVICLTRDFDRTYAVLSRDRTRPMVYGKTKEEIRALCSSRMEKYRKYAAVVIENNGSIEDCVQSVLKYLRTL